jgi:hypothetical protein
MQEDLILKVIGIAGGLAGVTGVVYKFCRDVTRATAERHGGYVVYRRDAPLLPDEHSSEEKAASK